MKQKLLLSIVALLGCMHARATFNATINGITYILDNGYAKAGVTASSLISGYTGKINIPSSVKYQGLVYNVEYIAAGAFEGNNITSVEIPSSVTSVNGLAFKDCKLLTSVNIPNSVTNIGGEAFCGCTSLYSITIPNGVTKIQNNTFDGCTNLISINIPSGVTYIEKEAFCDCSSLTSINIPDDVTYIGSCAFEGCSGLTSVTIGSSVKSIGESAFSGCSSLTSVTIPKSMTSIGSYAFYGCLGLTSIICEATSVPLIKSDAFYNILSSVTLYVPSSAMEDYKTTAPWSGFGNIVAIDEPVVEKCATPTISFVDGQVTFDCETEDVEFVYDITPISSISGEGTNVTLPIRTKYRVTVYATKSGYENSDVTTKEIDVSGIRGDVNGDGVVGMPDAMFIVNKLLNGKFPDE